MESLEQLAALLQKRNEIDSQIGQIISRPASTGHIGEWIASQVFDIDLAASADQKGFDGTFRSGPLAGKTVNVKMYGSHQGMLDATAHHSDCYLVLASSLSATTASRGEIRPFSITTAYLFDAESLTKALSEKDSASNARGALWTAAEIYPTPTNLALPLTDEQRTKLAFFAPDSQSPTPPMTL